MAALADFRDKKPDTKVQHLFHMKKQMEFLRSKGITKGSETLRPPMFSTAG
jgi:hypothetical protein